MLEALIHFVELAQSNTWLSLIYYLIFVLGVMALPITPFPIAGGVLFPFWVAFPLNLLCATLGAWLSFHLARRLGRKPVESFIKQRYKGWEKFSLLDGFKAVLILRVVGIPPFIVANYALGLSRVRQMDFLLGTMIGILPWMGIVTYLSGTLWQAVLVGGEKGLSKALFHVMGPMMLVSSMILVLYVYNIIARKRRHSNL